jgi:glutathione S-transferase/NAD(P)-dependent dehydrogenase (short-subunit alcohol dehydrogenase family)
VARRDADKARSLVEEITASGGVARAVGTDVRNEEAVQALFAQVEAELGPVEVCLFNAGANVKSLLIETSSKLFFKAWELACYAGFLTGREAARYMVLRSRGSILFTGATASVRGGAGFAAFAAAKFGLRAVAQSMARELAPKNIHVAHLVIDGAIDSQAIHRRLSAATGAMPDLAPDSLIQTSSVAEAYWALHNQSATAGPTSSISGPTASGGSNDRRTAASAGAVGCRNRPDFARSLGIARARSRLRVPALPRSGETQTQEYTELNPRQKIPLLQDSDFKIAESPAIAAYLSNTYGTRENALIPTDPREYATWLEWCFYAATELDATSLYVMRRHGDLKHIYGEAPTALEAAAQYFATQLRHAEQALEDGRTFLVGGRLTTADILLTTCLAWAVSYELPVTAACRAYLERITSRPAYRAGLAANTPRNTA